MIRGYVHHMTLSCGCRLLDWQDNFGAAGWHLRINSPGKTEKRSIGENRRHEGPAGKPFIGWSLPSCPVCGQPGGPWTETKGPVSVVADDVHVAKEEDGVPDGTYCGDLCCSCRTCPEGYWGRVGASITKAEQMDLFVSTP